MKNDNENCNLFTMSHEESDIALKKYFKKLLDDTHAKGITTTHSDGENVYTIDTSGKKTIIRKDTDKF